MKKSKFSDQQIAFALQQAETGTAVGDVCRKLGISEATFYRWKDRYGGLMPSEVRKLKHLEEENTRLRRLVSDLSLDKEMLLEPGRLVCRPDACVSALPAGRAANATQTTSAKGYGKTPGRSHGSGGTQRLLVDGLDVRSTLRRNAAFGSDLSRQLLQSVSRALGRTPGQDVECGIDA